MDEGLPISENVIAWRSERGWSQERLAELTDLHINTIKGLERSNNPNPRIETLTKLAEAFDISVCELISPQPATSEKPVPGATAISPGEPISAALMSMTSPATPLASPPVGMATERNAAAPIQVLLEHPEAIRLARRLGDFDTAHALLEECARCDGDCQVYGACAQEAEALGDNDLARTLLERALTLAPDDPDTIRSYADVLSLAGRWDEAERRYRSLPETFCTSDPQTLSLYIDHLIRNPMMVDEARQALERLKELAIGEDIAALEAAEMYIFALITHYKTLSIPLRAAEGTPNALSSVGTVLQTLSDKLAKRPTPASEGEKRRRALLFAMIAGIQADIGELRRAAKNYRDAISLYREADNLDANDHFHLQRLARQFRTRWQSPTVAVRLLRALLDDDPINEETWSELVAYTTQRNDVAPTVLRRMALTPPGRARLQLLDDLFKPRAESLSDVLDAISKELADERQEDRPVDPASLPPITTLFPLPVEKRPGLLRSLGQIA